VQNESEYAGSGTVQHESEYSGSGTVQHWSTFPRYGTVQSTSQRFGDGNGATRVNGSRIETAQRVNVPAVRNGAIYESTFRGSKRCNESTFPRCGTVQSTSQARDAFANPENEQGCHPG